MDTIINQRERDLFNIWKSTSFEQKKTSKARHCSHSFCFNIAFIHTLCGLCRRLSRFFFNMIKETSIHNNNNWTVLASINEHKCRRNHIREKCLCIYLCYKCLKQERLFFEMLNKNRHCFQFKVNGRLL